MSTIPDGAPWIWNRGQQLRAALGIPVERFTEIIDYYHVVERLHEMARTQGSPGDERHRRWIKVQKERLKEGKIEEIEAVVRIIAKKHPDAMAPEHAYWARNRERLRYGAFRERQLPIGSGAVESSVRRVINLRLKGASVTWTEPHAEGILHLRAHAKSGRWRELEHVVLRNSYWRPTARGATAA